jgi:hypothetical protein
MRSLPIPLLAAIVQSKIMWSWRPSGPGKRREFLKTRGKNFITRALKFLRRIVSWKLAIGFSAGPNAHSFFQRVDFQSRRLQTRLRLVPGALCLLQIGQQTPHFAAQLFNLFGLGHSPSYYCFSGGICMAEVYSPAKIAKIGM